MLFSHRSDRPHRASRRRALAALSAVVAALLLVGQTSVGAPGSAVAIVSNLGGALTVRDASGASHDVSGAQPLRSGDTVMTGINALASISLSGSLRARLGAGTVAQYYAQNSAPALRLSAGALCVAENTAGVTVAAAGTALTAVNTPAIFDIVTGHSGTTIVLYSGSVAAVASGSSSNVVQAPAAFAAVPGGQFTASPFDATASSIATMPCPDRDAARKTLAALPSPSPSPESTVAPASGGGGGGGVIGILAGIVGLAALAGHGGGGGGGGTVNPPPVPSPSPGALQVSPTSLSFSVGGAAQTVSATESNYGGALTASSPNPSVATVSPPSALSPATFTVTPVGPGSTSFTISDNHGGAIPVSVTVATPGQLTVSPLNFQTQPINSGPLALHVSESNYVGPFTVTSDQPNIVGISGGGNGPTPPPFFVTPTHQNAGPANITVKDSHSSPVVVPIIIAGPIVDNPTMLNGISIPTTFTSTDAFYTGNLSASSDNDAVATVTGGGPGPEAVTFTVTPHLQGNANITVSDSLGQTAVVPVSVSTGGLVLNPTSLKFNRPNGGVLTFNATEPNYNGNITPSGCTNIVSVEPPNGTGPSQDFTVTSIAPGSCTLTVVTGDHTANESITVYGDLQVAPPSLNFSDINQSQNVMVTEENYTGAFTIASNTCATTGFADVGQPSSGGPSATIVVTSLAPGPCGFQVQDNHGGSKPVSVTVGPFGDPVPSPNPLTLNIVNTLSGTIAVSELGYTGNFTPSSSDCTNIATFDSTPATSFTINAVNQPSGGTCHILFSDDHGGSALGTVVVDGALALSPNPINFSDTVTSPVAINEANYTGAFNVINDLCAGTATIGSPAGPGPSTTVAVTAVTPGNCKFDIQDSDGQAVTEIVQIGPVGPPTPSTAELDLNTAGPLSGTFMISESGYTGGFTLTPSSACANVVSVSPGTGNQSTIFTVTATGTLATCGIRIADDFLQNANVEVEVAAGTIAVSPASLSFASSSSPPQVATATDSGANSFLCVSSDPVNVSATITPPGSSTCSIAPTNANPGFIGTAQVTFTDSNPSSSAVVQVGIGTQPLSKHHHPTPGGVKRPVPAPRGSHPPVVPGVPLPIPNANPIVLSAPQLTLSPGNAHQTFTANVGNYIGSLTATSSAPNIVDVSIVPGGGPVRMIAVVAKAAGTAIIRVADERGNSSSIRILVIPATLNRPGPGTGSRPGGPPAESLKEQREDHR